MVQFGCKSMWRKGLVLQKNVAWFPTEENHVHTATECHVRGLSETGLVPRWISGVYSHYSTVPIFPIMCIDIYVFVYIYICLSPISMLIIFSNFRQKWGYIYNCIYIYMYYCEYIYIYYYYYYYYYIYYCKNINIIVYIYKYILLYYCIYISCYIYILLYIYIYILLYIYI